MHYPVDVVLDGRLRLDELTIHLTKSSLLELNFLRPNHILLAR